MKLPSFLRPATVIAVIGLTGGFLRADIITMKTGEKYEAKILEQTNDTIKIEYKLTPKIKDTKVLDRANIQSIKTQTPSEIEFEEKALAKIVPTPDLLTPQDYEALIHDKLLPFAAKYPGTPEAAEVQKMITTLTEEKAKVAAGQIKMEGKWLDAPTVHNDKYHIEAYALRLQMKNKAAEPNDMRYINALRIFDKLQSEYPASIQYVQAIPEALEIMDLYEKQLTQMIKAQPVLSKDRDTGLKALPPNEAVTTRAAIQKEIAEYKKTRLAETKSKVIWKTIYPYDLKDLQESLTTLQTNRKVLATLDLDKLRHENETYITIIRLLANDDIASAKAEIDRAAKSAPAGTHNPILDGFRKQAEGLERTAEKNKQKTAQASTVQQPVNTGDHAMDTSNPLAESLKKIEAEKKKKADAERKAKAAKEEEKARLAAAAQQPPEEESFISQYGIYIGGGLAAILAGALFFAKRSKKED